MRIVTTGPNQALIISGRGSKPRIIVGGRAFVLPIIERLEKLSLEIKTLNVKTQNVYTLEGVPVSVDGVAQIKVHNTDESIRLAAQNFLSKDGSEIENIALQSMEGQLRAILGTMTVEQIYKDRKAFADQVKEVSETDLSNMGLQIVSFTIREITDPNGYLDALGVKRTAEVKRDAQIGQAESDRDALIRSSEADREGKSARYTADTHIAESNKLFSVQKSLYDIETNAKKTEADLASELQSAKTRQSIEAENIKIDFARTVEQIKVQELEIQRKMKEQEASIRVPAEAQRFKIEQEAEAEKAKITAIGQAEAAAILAKGKAEAEAMEMKAQAWNRYGDAAVIQLVVDKLPEIAREIGNGFSSVDRIVIIGGGSDGGGIGGFADGFAGLVAKIPAIVESLTGIDITKKIQAKLGSEDNITVEEPIVPMN